MSDEPVWVGLDLGTQSARALVVASDGELLATGSHALEGERDGPRHEQRPDDWWAAVAAACRAALGEAAAGEVGGVACCSTSGTVLLTDPAGAPLTPGVMYDDARAEDEAGQVAEAGEAVWAALGLRIGASWGLPKLVRLLGETRDPAGARLAHQADVVTARLVGRPVPTDWSHALKSGYDLVRDGWPHAVLDALEVPDGVLPEVVCPGTRLGAVAPEAAEATGLPAGAPVLAGMTDGYASQIGAGALGVGAWNAVLGTTLVLKGVTGELVVDPAGVVYSHRSPDGPWLPGGASSVGAGVLTARFADRDLDALGDRAAEREPAGAVVYPLVPARGERFPFIAPDAEAFALGEPVDEADSFAALLQGVALAERLCFDYLDLLGAPVDGELTLTGGGARSHYWCQLRADVLERPVRLVEHAEAGFGMAVLAASSRRESVADAAAAMVRVREEIVPRPDRAGRFREPYLRLVDALVTRGWLSDDVADHARGRAAA